MVASPRVSVVLPTYNAAAHVEEALRSVLNQTFADFELLVVDDGSTDGTREIVDSFADDRLRVIEREESGLASALNRGIEESRGEYVARHDADDRSAPTRFARQIAYLDAHPDVAMVGTGAYLLDTDGTVEERRRVLERPSFDDILDTNRFVHGAVLFRRSALSAVGGYDERFAVSEDYDLWLRLATEYPVRNIDEPLYALRVRSGSIYGSQLEAAKLYGRYAALRATDNVPDSLRERIAEEGISVVYDELSTAERAAHHRELGMELLRYGARRDARHHCVRAIELSPTALMAYPLLTLSFAPTSVIRFAVRAYRTVLNLRIEHRNRRAGDRQYRTNP